MIAVDSFYALETDNRRNLTDRCVIAASTQDLIKR